MTALMSNYARIPLTFVEGEGCFLTSESGERYLDFLSGVAVNSLGHAHPALTNALLVAAKMPIHVSNYYEIPGQEQAAATLCKLAKTTSVQNDEYRAVFGNSGAEANEAALKIVRKYTGRSKVISFFGGFHGRTYGALSMTAKPEIHNGFAPLVPDCEYAAFNDDEAIARIDNETAAVIVEFVQGEGGVNVARQKWIDALFTQAKSVGALVIADEVQTGCGRTGTFFSFEHFGVVPDIITLAKGLGGGVPVGVMLAKTCVAEVFTPGTHGSTFAGSPLICTVVNAVLGVIAEETFLHQVARHAEYFFEELQKIAAQYPEKICDIRGIGFLIGVEFVPENAAKNVWVELRRHKVLCGTAGSNVLRILPPLIASKSEIDLFLDIFQKVLLASK